MRDSHRTSQHRRLDDAATRIAELTEPVFSGLAELGGAAAAALEAHGAGDETWTLIGEQVSQLLHDHRLATGAGLALDWASSDGAAIDSNAASAATGPYFTWWIRRDGAISRKYHVLNPSSEAYYDVTLARWFRLPLASGGRTLMAPYVDSWGTDDFTMTASLPISWQASAALVVAADLDARLYVDQAERILADTGATALLDEEQRVIASTVGDLESGARLSPAVGYVMEGKVSTRQFGWCVAALAPRS